MQIEHANEQVPDVFISYAHADDEIPYGAKYGWVTTFVEELKKTLRRMLGGNGARIWMDYQLAANDRVTETLLNTVCRSRTLVLFMSRGYSRSEWCQKELGNFLDVNQAHKHKESVFIVALNPTERENWHPRLRELTPIQLWRKGLDDVPELLGWPVPRPDQDKEYWGNLNKLAHLIADHLVGTPDETESIIRPSPPNAKPVIWIAEPTDDVIDQWEAMVEAIRQAGADTRPLGLYTYPRSSESEFLACLRTDLGSANLFVQLLGQLQGGRPKGGSMSFTALQSAIASDLVKRRQLALLQWRSRDIKLENVADEGYRQLLTGAIACGFEEFRQRVLMSIQNLRQPSPAEKPLGEAEESLAICISASKSDQDLGRRVRDILVDLGADALTAPTEPTPDQTPTDFNSQLDEVMTGSEGVIIVYGQTGPAWVQAQYVRARKVLALRRKGVWGALLDGPPRDKPEAGVASRNLMMLDCRDGPQRQHIERFVNALRETDHA
jgi:hypothetical protein